MQWAEQMVPHCPAFNYSLEKTGNGTEVARDQLDRRHTVRFFNVGNCPGGGVIHLFSKSPASQVCASVGVW